MAVCVDERKNEEVDCLSAITGKSVAKTAAQSALGNPHFDYAVKDCQGWVEWCWAQNGYRKNYRGSNDMYRNACVWVGTKEQCIAKYGKIPVGALTFKIRKYDPAKCSAKYNDGIGDVYHVGLYCAGIDGVETGHSSNGGSQTAKLSTWSHVGITKGIEYDFGNASTGQAVPSDLSVSTIRTAVIISEDGNPVKLRGDPSKKNPYIAKVPVGMVVDVHETGESDGILWSTVAVNGKRGYIMSQFLKITG